MVYFLKGNNVNPEDVSVAQWIARRTSNPEVVGSSPTGDDRAFFWRHKISGVPSDGV